MRLHINAAVTEFVSGWRSMWRVVFPPKRQRVASALVTYAAAEPLLKRGWTIAPEEDTNKTVGPVYLELLERRQ